METHSDDEGEKKGRLEDLLPTGSQGQHASTVPQRHPGSRLLAVQGLPGPAGVQRPCSGQLAWQQKTNGSSSATSSSVLSPPVCSSPGLCWPAPPPWMENTGSTHTKLPGGVLASGEKEVLPGASDGRRWGWMKGGEEGWRALFSAFVLLELLAFAAFVPLASRQQLNLLSPGRPKKANVLLTRGQLDGPSAAPRPERHRFTLQKEQNSRAPHWRRDQSLCCCWKVTNERSRRCCCRDLVERSSICNPHASKNSPTPLAAAAPQPGEADEDAETPSFAISFGILHRRCANEASCWATVSARSPHSRPCVLCACTRTGSHPPPSACCF